jgi:hypothetical protein
MSNKVCVVEREKHWLIERTAQQLVDQWLKIEVGDGHGNNSPRRWTAAIGSG